jgi:hypothetical protein
MIFPSVTAPRAVPVRGASASIELPAGTVNNLAVSDMGALRRVYRPGYGSAIGARAEAPPAEAVP